MAYTRKAPKQDIRSLSLQALAKGAPNQTPDGSLSSKSEPINLHHRPLQEVRLILLCSLPLIAALALSWYYDTKYHWVVAFANWLTRLGT